MAHIGKYGEKWRAFVVPSPGKRVSKVFTLKADAQRWARQLEVEIDRGDYNPASSKRFTVEQLAHEWLNAQLWRDTTREQQESIVKNWVLPTFGHRQVQAVTWSEIKAWVSEMDGTHLAPSSVIARYRTLVSIFNQAVADQLIRANPATLKKITLPKPTTSKADRFYLLSPTEITELLTEMAAPLKCFALIGVGAGLRPGEISGLKPGDLDLVEGEGLIRVRQQVTTTKAGPSLGPLKTRSSSRDVPIPDELVRAIQQHLEVYPALVCQGERMLFTNRYGVFWRRNTLGSAWQKARADACIDDRARGWHQLRHFYASSLIAAGETVATVQNRLGHSSPVETLETYLHLWPDNEVGTREAVSSSFANIGWAKS